MKNEKLLILILSVFFLCFSFAKRDRMPDVQLDFEVFQDTIVAGFEMEIKLITGYELNNLSISSTNCNFLLKDPKTKTYKVKAPMTSAGKKCEIKVSLKNKSGSFSTIGTFTVPIVAMTTEMKKRYVNNLNHKK